MRELGSSCISLLKSVSATILLALAILPIILITCSISVAVGYLYADFSEKKGSKAQVSGWGAWINFLILIGFYLFFTLFVTMAALPFLEIDWLWMFLANWLSNAKYVLCAVGSVMAVGMFLCALLLPIKIAVNIRPQWRPLDRKE